MTYARERLLNSILVLIELTLLTEAKIDKKIINMHQDTPPHPKCLSKDLSSHHDQGTRVVTQMKLGIGASDNAKELNV